MRLREWRDVHSQLLTSRRSVLVTGAIEDLHRTASGDSRVVLRAETGGRSYFVAKADELDGVYSEISRELRSQYLLAFAPDPPGQEGVFSTVEVRARGGKLKARAPRGYYP